MRPHQTERQVWMEKNSKKRKSGVLYRVIVAILLCIIAFCIYKIAAILADYREGTAVYDRIAEIGDVIPEETLHVDFAALKGENDDVIAWLYSEGTVINYPVVQGEDNSYYLYRLADGTWNPKGSLFADYRCEKPFADFNTIIYGHRMNDGSMFKSLIEYRDTEGYYEAHKVMRLAAPDAEYEIAVFGADTIPADDDMYKLQFGSDEEKAAYIERIRKNNEIPSGGGSDVEVEPSDRIVMLSTCTYEFDDARLVVWGKLTEINS